MPWQVNGTPDTVTGVADIMTIPDLTPLKFNVIMCHALNSGLIDTFLRFDGDSGNNYARRASIDGNTDGVFPNQTQIENSPADSADSFSINYVINIVDEEKLVISFGINQNAVGAGTIPDRSEIVGKYVVAGQFTATSITNSRAGDYATDSNLSALGTD